MQTQPQEPVSWFIRVLINLQWPVIVCAAFALGRYVKGIEVRVAKSEKQLSDIIERHLPHIHNALARIEGLLSGRGKG